jgi:hypothetical protein
VHSHQLIIESEYWIAREGRICRLSSIEVISEDILSIIELGVDTTTFLVFRDTGGSLSSLVNYHDQLPVALFIQKFFNHRRKMMHDNFTAIPGHRADNHIILETYGI